MQFDTAERYGQKKKIEEISAELSTERLFFIALWLPS